MLVSDFCRFPQLLISRDMIFFRNYGWVGMLCFILYSKSCCIKICIDWEGRKHDQYIYISIYIYMIKDNLYTYYPDACALHILVDFVALLFLEDNCRSNWPLFTTTSLFLSSCFFWLLNFDSDKWTYKKNLTLFHKRYKKQISCGSDQPRSQSNFLRLVRFFFEGWTS